MSYTYSSYLRMTASSSARLEIPSGDLNDYTSTYDNVEIEFKPRNEGSTSQALMVIRNNFGLLVRDSITLDTSKGMYNTSISNIYTKLKLKLTKNEKFEILNENDEQLWTSTTSFAFSTSSVWYLFNNPAATAPTRPPYLGELYSIKIYEDSTGTVKHNLIPATDGVLYGLLDTVTNKFYTNAVSDGSFTGEPLSNLELTEIQVGANIYDIKDAIARTSINSLENDKQDTLIPGDGIKIYIDNTIEADYKIYSVSDSIPGPDIKIGSGVWNNDHYLIKRKSFIVNATDITWDIAHNTATLDISPYFSSNAETFIAKYSVSVFNTVNNTVHTLPIISNTNNELSILELLQINWHTGIATFYLSGTTFIGTDENFLFDIMYYELQPE